MTMSTNDSSDAHLPIEGEVIQTANNRYQIGKFVGRGAFGCVYECTDEWANELVAKVMLPGAEAGHARAAWVREATNLVQLRHPNITYIYDVCEHKSAFYIIMERCGSDLTSLFKISGYDAGFWIPALARDVLQAIEYIHREGYVHKDLHPGNIFVAWTRDRMVPRKDPVVSFKIGDLGIAREESNIDVFNTMLAQWMLPPEALDPVEFGPVGRAIDVYHVGLVLLSLLLGRIPTFTRDEVLAGKPRETAEALQSVYAPAIAMALRRHAAARPTITQLWNEIVRVMPADRLPL